MVEYLESFLDLYHKQQHQWYQAYYFFRKPVVTPITV